MTTPDDDTDFWAEHTVTEWQANVKDAIERGEFTTASWPKGYGKYRFAREVEDFEAFLREIGQHPDE